MPADVRAQLAAGPPAPSGAVGTASEPSTTRDDSYTLDVGDSEPIVHVDLIWPEGPDPTAGHLLVSEDSGQVLYDVPLVGLTSIDVKLPIPSGVVVTSDLEIKLQIKAPGSSSYSTGSYHLDVDWVQSPRTIPPSTSTVSPPPQVARSPSGVVASAPGALPANAVTVLTSPIPGISATRGLPPATSSSTTVGPESSPGVGATSGLTSLSDPALNRIVVIPSAPSTAPALAPSSNSSGSGSSSSSPLPVVPLPSAVGLATSINGAGSRPAVVGPLPLSGATPDGGIFAYPYGQGRVNDSSRATLAIVAAPDPLDSPDVPHRRWPRDFGVTVPREIPREWPSIASPIRVEMAGRLSSTGAAYLPPLAHLDEDRLARRPDKSGASRWPILSSRTKPKTSLAALVVGSTSLFLGLVAPDWVTRLANWQDDRRWKRQVPFLQPSKRKPDPDWAS